MRMNLYEINAQIESLLEQMVDVETGVVDDSVAEQLEELALTRDQKIENTALYIKNLNAEIEAIKAEKKSFEQRLESATKKAAWLKDYLSLALGGQKFETPRVKLSFRASTKVRIEDEAEFLRRWQGNVDYLSYKTPTVNKTNIMAALKAGELIDGAELEKSNNLQIK